MRRRIIPTCVGKSENPAHGALVRTDHPHVRGEKSANRNRSSTICGSSPRAWGKGGRLAGRVDRQRIIPTCVGKRSQERGQMCWHTDHPHVRGEKIMASPKMRHAHGSSPRAWGKAWRADRSQLQSRIIPTCVGKSG